MAVLNVNPTRMQLSKLKKQLATATRGHKMLKDKRDELMRRFLDLVKENKALREKIENELAECGNHFVNASAVMSKEALDAALMSPKQRIDLEISSKNVMSVDIPQFNEDMNALLSGKTIELPRFNFKTGKREYKGEMLKLGKKDILVIEGIHCLNDEFSHSLPKESKYKIYISCLTTLNIDDHNRIPTTDARLLRRIERDARTRGYGAQATIKMWPSVRRGEEQNIFPYQDSADTVFNSSLIYETALLKPYVQPLLFGVPRGSDEYLEAKRLLKFLDYFLPVPADDVPQTSLMREFVGGGIYKT